MKIAHVRARAAPSDRPWRLFAALDSPPRHWVDFEVARLRAVAAQPALVHDALLYRERITTLDDHLARGMPVAALADLVEGFSPRGGPDEDEAIIEEAQLRFGPPLLGPGSLRDGYGFEGHVRTTWHRSGREIPEAWYRLAVFYFQNVSEIRGPDDPVWAPAGSVELDYELEIAALIDRSARDLTPPDAESAIGGYMIFNDWSARDLQRDEATLRLGPAKGKDFASSFGPWLVTPDELEDARLGLGFDLGMSATVNGVELSRGRWSEAVHGFGGLAARASADAWLRPGDLLGSGTVGTGCLLEIGDATLGRYLEPGDEVILTVDRLGSLRTPIVARPTG